MEQRQEVVRLAPPHLLPVRFQQRPMKQRQEVVRLAPPHLLSVPLRSQPPPQ